MYLCTMDCNADIYYHGPVVAFDLDDTLCSEREHALQAYGAVAAMPGPDCLPEARDVMARALAARENPFDALVAALAEAGIDSPTGIADWLAVYRAYEPERLTLYPDARETLTQLHDRGVRMAVITDGRIRTQRAKIRALGIEDFFHPADVLISEETGHDKHDADNFASLVHHYPEAKRFIYVGDNPAKDFEWPELLGWECYCLAAREGNIHPQDAPSAATVIPSLTLILDTL